jgi:hypothetical protein
MPIHFHEVQVSSECLSSIIGLRPNTQQLARYICIHMEELMQPMTPNPTHFVVERCYVCVRRHVVAVSARVTDSKRIARQRRVSGACPPNSYVLTHRAMIVMQA